MSRTELIKNSFTGGEISPSLLGRTDLAKYQVSCESIQNFFVKVQGGLHRRWGTRYIVDAGGPNRLIPFIVSTTQRYVIELGQAYMRFYTNDGQIQTAPGVPYQISTVYNLADVFNIHFVQIISEMYLVHPNYPVQKLIRINDTNWQIITPTFYAQPAITQDQDVGTSKSASITISGATVTASNPVFINGDVGKAVVAGTGIGYITTLSGTTTVDGTTGATLYPVATIQVTNPFDSAAYATGSWFLRGSPGAYFSPGQYVNSTNHQWIGSGNFSFNQLIPVRSTTLHPTDRTWLTSVGGTNIPVQYTGGFTDCFRTIDVGSYVPFSGGYGQIAAVISSTQVTVRIFSIPTITEQNAYGNPLIAPAPPGSWYYEVAAFGPGNYPGAIAMYGDRLFLAGTQGNNPNTVWGSGVGDYENFSLGDLDNSGLRFTINTSSFDSIKWLEVYQGNMTAGSSENEYIINGGSGQAVISAGAPLTPQNINVIKQSKLGVSGVQPALIDNDLLFIHQTGTSVYRFSFDAITSSYGSTNLSVFNELITLGQLKEMVYQGRPNKIVWFTDTANNLVGLTYDKEQDVWGWHRHFTGVDTLDGVVSITNISAYQSNNVVDELWMLCQRNRAGATVYTIEIMQTNLWLDCASQQVFGSPVSSIGNLQYLAGRPVTVNADGVVLPTVVMDNTGVYTFPAFFTGLNVQAGINYTSYAETVRPEPRSTIQGLVKRWVKIWARIYESLSLEINSQEIVFRNLGDVLYAATPVFTGDVQVTNLGFTRNGRIRIQQVNPLPTHLLALFGIFEISDGI